MVLSSFSEIISLGVVFPFLGALGNPESLLSNPKVQTIWTFLKIDSAEQLITTLALLFAMAVVVANGLRLATVHAQTRLAAAIGSDISCQAYVNTLRQPYSFHVRHNSSDLVNIVTADSDRLTRSILVPVLELITNSFVILALIGGLLLISGWVAIVAAIIIGSVYTFIYRIRQKILKQNSQTITRQNQQKIKVVQEGLGGIRDVLLNGTGDFFQRAYQNSEYSLKQAVATNAITALLSRVLHLLESHLSEDGVVLRLGRLWYFCHFLYRR
ncbi:MAG: ABC transporter transmembrane domain-containing protein [Bacteroidota bacterium]